MLFIMLGYYGDDHKPHAEAVARRLAETIPGFTAELMDYAATERNLALITYFENKFWMEF